MSSTAVALRVTLGTLTVGAAALAADRVRALQRWREERLAVTPEHHDLDAQTVRLASAEGHDLHGWWLPSSVRDDAPAVLVVHGFASHAGDMLPLGALLHEAGFHVLLLDLRGHGRSDAVSGPVRPPLLAADVRTAVAWLRDQDGVGAVGVVGHSMGGTVSILAAADDPSIGALVSVAGVADPTLTRIGWWPAWVSRALIGVMAARENVDAGRGFAVHRLPEVAAPVLLVHGERDQVVPVAHAHALHRAAPHHELALVPEARHASFEEFAPAMDRSIGFLRDHLEAFPTG